MSDTKRRILALAIWVLVVTFLHYTTGKEARFEHALHLLFRLAYLIPIIAASIWFGMRGFIGTTLPVCVLYWLHVLLHWQGHIAENMNQLLTLLTYIIIGCLSAVLAQQVETHRKARYLAETNRRRDLLLGAVDHFSSALHWRDTYTQRHCEQVSRIAETLAQAFGLDPHRVELTRLAGKLHDIGKIGIRDDILLKPGSLSEVEREAIRRHPMVAFDMLRHIEGAEQVAAIVLAHHERPDGKGYPKGLSGTEIPFEAQIVAVADVFSALTEDRPYHQGMALDRVIHLMTERKGTQLNGDIVAALFRLLKSHSFKEYACAGK